jgi:hypothetical protein
MSGIGIGIGIGIVGGTFGKPPSALKFTEGTAGIGGTPGIEGKGGSTGEELPKAPMVGGGMGCSTGDMRGDWAGEVVGNGSGGACHGPVDLLEGMPSRLGASVAM